MPRSHPLCPPEVRNQITKLVQAGRAPAELANEFEATAQTISNWIAQADRDDDQRHDGLTSAEREELGVDLGVMLKLIWKSFRLSRVETILIVVIQVWTISLQWRMKRSITS